MRLEMNQQNNQPLNLLIGRHLSAVVFVEDYVQFQFEGPDIYLSAHETPFVVIDGKTIEPASPNWRNSLCELIGSRVCSAEFSPTHFHINFDSKHLLCVPIRQTEDANVEAGELSFGPSIPTIVF